MGATNSINQNNLGSLKFGIIRGNHVCQALGLSRSTVWRMVRSGDLPAPIRLGGNSVGWHVHEIEAWLQSRPRTANPSVQEDC